MQLSEFTFRVILVLLPGFASFIVLNHITVHRPFRLHHVLLYSLLLGFLCYLSYFIINSVAGLGLPFTIIKSLSSIDREIDLLELVYVVVWSQLVALGLSAVINHNIVVRFARLIRVSRVHGEAGVWGWVMNTNNTEWVVVRDIENDLAYEGWIQVFSDVGEADEILLRDVIVFTNKSAEKLYEVPALYLPRDRNKLTIEFKDLDYSEEHQRELAISEDIDNG